jgi:hypothetical protein
MQVVTNFTLVTAWTPFERCVVPTDGLFSICPVRAVWKNSLFTVFVHDVESGDGWPAMLQLSIRRNDRAPIDDWRAMQRIKNEIVGPENEAVELYPAESRLVDTANQYHLWVLVDPRARFPFGFRGRLVSETTIGKSQQRPWDDDVRPKDLRDAGEMARRASEALDDGRIVVAVPGRPMSGACAMPSPDHAHCRREGGEAVEGVLCSCSCHETDPDRVFGKDGAR